MSDDFRLTHPTPAPRFVRPARVTGRDPYRVPGPAVVSVSGGRTSAYMLRRVLDAYGGRLPSDIHAVFANTGDEHPGTLDFVREISVRWGVPIMWVEYDTDAPNRYREVEYETASRKAEPMRDIVTTRNYLPNWQARFCTQELKIAPMRAVMQAIMAEHGTEDAWTNIVGLRWDEPDRVAKLRARDAEWDIAAPLYDARVSKADVLAFWAAQDFDLKIPPWAGNCVGCFLKKRSHREAAAREMPEVIERWAALEAMIGARLINAEPEGYAGTLDRVRRLPVLQLVDDPDEAVSLPCDCTQRRAPRPRSCTCGRRRGEGHALHCARVFDTYTPGVIYAPASTEAA
jgi:3'-phosphoadenosine 5'-phosphosulfate sulfotransferase (PAPS reductase)/FAD synthetase